MIGQKFLRATKMTNNFLYKFACNCLSFCVLERKCFGPTSQIFAKNTMYLFPLKDSGSGPKISTASISNGSTTEFGFLVPLIYCRGGFFS